MDNSKSQGGKWVTKGGKNTKDRVFLLSYAEAEKYFSSDFTRKCTPTDYAVRKGAVAGKADWWWLRSTEVSDNIPFAACVYDKGYTSYISGVTNGGVLVRPALWVDLASGVF